MRKIYAILITVVFLFSMIVFADEPAYNSDKNIALAFSASPEYGSDSIKLKLSELSGGGISSFSFNRETGFIHAQDGLYSLFIKELDTNIDINETSLELKNIKGIDLSSPYRFKVLAYIYRQNAVTVPEGTAISVMTEAALEVSEGKAQITLQKPGTSYNAIIGNGGAGKNIGNNLLMVNRNNTLERSYFPDGLIYGKPVRGRATVSVRLNREAMQQINLMLDTAYREGVSGMVITSAFRTFDKQTSLFNNKTSLLSRSMDRKSAAEEASKIVAVPGSSEHQTGLAADICSERVGVVKEFAKTKQGKWLEDNSWRYGFIVRYPEEKTKYTGIIYEPWHVRYVGDGHSEIMKNKSLCLEEYVEYLKDNKLVYFDSSSGDQYVVQYIDKGAIDSGEVKFSLPGSSSWTISNCTKDSYILTIKL